MDRTGSSRQIWKGTYNADYPSLQCDDRLCPIIERILCWRSSARIRLLLQAVVTVWLSVIEAFGQDRVRGWRVNFRSHLDA